MKLTDAILAGTRVHLTPGPTPVHDCLTVAQAGLLGRLPSSDEARAFYWANPWGIEPGSDLEYWMRLVVLHGYRWADVLKKLGEYGL